MAFNDLWDYCINQASKHKKATTMLLFSQVSSLYHSHISNGEENCDHPRRLKLVFSILVDGEAGALA